MKNIHIREINTEKYLNWLLGEKGLSKEADLQRLEKEYQERIQWIDANESLSEGKKSEAREQAKDRRDKLIEATNKTTYWTPPTDDDKRAMQFDIEHSMQWRTDQLNSMLERSPIARKTVLTERLEYMLKKEFDHYKNIHRDIVNGCLVQNFFELGHYIGFIRFAQYLDKELEKEENKAQLQKDGRPIKWLGKPSHLGYIMSLLAESGYIEAPRKKDGEISYIEYARQLYDVIDFDGTLQTLAKYLSQDTNNMENHNRNKFKIPHIKELT